MTATRAGWREVARRAGGDVELSILWNESRSRVKVLVSDRSLCNFVDLEVDSADALTAFHEAFADATSRLSAGESESALSERLSTGTNRKD